MYDQDVSERVDSDTSYVRYAVAYVKNQNRNINLSTSDSPQIVLVIIVNYNNLY